MLELAMKNPDAKSDEDLCRDWLAAKHAENDAKAWRCAIETLLIDRLGCKDDGQESYTVGEHKVSIKGNLKRTIDQDKLQDTIAKLPKEHQSVVVETTSYKLDMGALRFLEKNAPESIKILSSCLTTQPMKPTVKVEAI